MSLSTPEVFDFINDRPGNNHFKRSGTVLDQSLWIATMKPSGQNFFVPSSHLYRRDYHSGTPRKGREKWGKKHDIFFNRRHSCNSLHNYHWPPTVSLLPYTSSPFQVLSSSPPNSPSSGIQTDSPLGPPSLTPPLGSFSSLNNQVRTSSLLTLNPTTEFMLYRHRDPPVPWKPNVNTRYQMFQKE